MSINNAPPVDILHAAAVEEEIEGDEKKDESVFSSTRASSASVNTSVHPSLLLRA